MQEELPRTRVSANTTVLQTAICFVDGADAGTLLYRGYPFAELIERAGYGAVAWLLWTGELPSAGERDDLVASIVQGAAAAAVVASLLEQLPAGATPQARLLAALPLLPVIESGLVDRASAADPRQAALLLGAFAALASGAASGGVAADPAAIGRLFSNGVAGGFLALARGGPAPDREVRAFEQLLILFAEHELNASTFAARVAASTRAGLVTCVIPAFCTLNGPLHGGVEGHVRALLASAETEGAEGVVERYERAGRALPGFGHAVYRNGDPRAAVTRRLAAELAPGSVHERTFALTCAVEEIAGWRRLPRANVDLYAATVYRALGIPDALTPLVFATARVAGWCAHILEQYAHNRLIRPRAEYIGPEPRHWPAG